MKKDVNITNAEWKIMVKLWEGEPYTITELVNALKVETGWSQATVITMLKRLVKKECIYFIEGERAKKFYAAVKREEVVTSETQSFLNKLYGGSVGMMLNSMVQYNSITKDDLDEIYKLIKEKDKSEGK